MSKKIEFKPPDDVIQQIGNVPAGTRLELMTNYEVKENGSWCIVNIEGAPMPGYDGEGNPEGKDDEGFVSKFQQAMSGGEGHGGY